MRTKNMTGAPAAHSLKAAALRYAANGWPVFLLGRSKRPIANCPQCTVDGAGHDPQACQCLTCHGFYAATFDPKRIAAMFANVPAPMLAIRTGYASRLVVVDVDPAHGGTESLSMLVSRGLTPPTAYVRTGSGGLHLFYRHPGGKVPCSQGRLGPGIDVRADGGYVVAAPSTHPRTRQPYLWADERTPIEMLPALVNACLPAPHASTCTPVTSSNTASRGERISSPDRLLSALLASVEHSLAGKRRTTLYGAARGAARMVASGVISRDDAETALLTVGLAVGQSERDALAAIGGGFRDEGVMA